MRPFTLTMPDNRYWTVGEHIGDAWSVGRGYGDHGAGCGSPVQKFSLGGGDVFVCPGCQRENP